VHAADESEHMVHYSFYLTSDREVLQTRRTPSPFDHAAFEREIVTGNLTLLRQEAPSMINQCKPQISEISLNTISLSEKRSAQLPRASIKRGYVIEIRRGRVGIGRRPVRQMHDT
jgi:hypothetical protein